MSRGNAPIIIDTIDGIQLSGTLYARGSATKTIVIAGATGVPEKFYSSFARWLRAQGIDVITFAYRGLGGGRSLASNPARKLDWMKYDIPAAITYADRRGQPVYLLGHSVGGQGLKAIIPIDPLSGIITVCCSSGYIYYTKNWIRSLLILKIYIPLSVLIFGYARLRTLGLGSDLAPGVARDFSRWCSRRGYALGDRDIISSLDIAFPIEIDIPVLRISTRDDPLATVKNQNDLWRFYSLRNCSQYEGIPAHGESLGHVGFFKSANKSHWMKIKNWLDKQM
jgi:predicted alpha/beta hydrolase